MVCPICIAQTTIALCTVAASTAVAVNNRVVKAPIMPVKIPIRSDSYRQLIIDALDEQDAKRVVRTMKSPS